MERANRTILAALPETRPSAVLVDVEDGVAPTRATSGWHA
jgi:hypothetical protein